MAGSYAENPPIRDIQFYKDLAQRDLELIEDQKKEIGMLKAECNTLRQRVQRYKNSARNWNFVNENTDKPAI